MKCPPHPRQRPRGSRRGGKEKREGGNNFLSLSSPLCLCGTSAASAAPAAVEGRGSKIRISKMSERSRKTKSIEKEIAELRREILEHDHRYYTLSEPMISDAEYDALMRRLRELESERPDMITHDSPT